MPVTVPVNDFPAVIAQSSVPSVASVSVDNVGRSFSPQNPPRRVKFLIEWKEHTIPVVLDDTETLGTVTVNACMEINFSSSSSQWTHNQAAAHVRKF